MWQKDVYVCICSRISRFTILFTKMIFCCWFLTTSCMMFVPTVSQHQSLKTPQPYLGLLLKHPLENRKLKVSSFLSSLNIFNCLWTVFFLGLTLTRYHFKITGFSKLILTLCLRRWQLSQAWLSQQITSISSLCLPPPLTYFLWHHSFPPQASLRSRFCPSALLLRSKLKLARWGHVHVHGAAL